MVLKWECGKLVDLPRSAELGDLDLCRCFTKISAVEIEIAALNLPIFRAGLRLLLLSEIIFDASRAVCARASRINKGVWLEQGP